MWGGVRNWSTYNFKDNDNHILDQILITPKVSKITLNLILFYMKKVKNNYFQGFEFGQVRGTKQRICYQELLVQNKIHHEPIFYIVYMVLFLILTFPWSNTNIFYSIHLTMYYIIYTLDWVVLNNTINKFYCTTLVILYNSASLI